MALKDILVHVDGALGTGFAFANALARRHDAHVAALHAYDAVGPAAMAAAGDANPAAVERFIRETQEAERETSATLRAQCEGAWRRDGIAGEWRVVEGTPDLVVQRHARFADLAVFSRGPVEGSRTDGVALAQAALFGTGRPVVVAPPRWDAGTAPGRVLVAWSGTRESARAIHDALDLLAAAERVRLLTVAAVEGLEEARLDADFMARHLARHGVNATAEVTAGGEARPDELILNSLADGADDLLVIGGYGHSRLREMMLGGVTREMLRHAPVPVLLAH